MDEIGRRAEKVREYNKTRVRYMNELDMICGSEHVTEKVKHLSEDIYEKFYKGRAYKSRKKNSKVV